MSSRNAVAAVHKGTRHDLQGMANSTPSARSSIETGSGHKSSRIAHSLGYDSHAAFCAMFRKTLGCASVAIPLARRKANFSSPPRPLTVTLVICVRLQFLKCLPNAVPQPSVRWVGIKGGCHACDMLTDSTSKGRLKDMQANCSMALASNTAAQTQPGPIWQQ